MATVLVVDDEPTIRRLITTVLSDTGFEAVGAPDAETAMSLLESERPDVIVTDIRLPGMDGVEFAKRLKQDERFSCVPLAFISAWEAPPQFESPPPVAFFRKPFDLDELTDWVASAYGDCGQDANR